MKSNNTPSSLFKRHAIFPLIFTFLFLALLASSVAVVRQQQVYKSRADYSGNGGLGKSCLFANESGGSTGLVFCDGDLVCFKNGKNIDGRQLESTWKGGKCQCPQGQESSGGSKCKATTANCGGNGQACCPTAFGSACKSGYLFCLNNKCQTISCSNGTCPAGKACSNFGFGPVCALKTAPGAGSGNGGGTDYGQSDACSARGGICSDINSACPEGKSHQSGLCPGPSSWQCCVPNGGGGAGGGGAAPAPAAPAPAAKTPTAAPSAPTTAAPTATPKPGDVVLDLKLKFQGITKQPKDNQMDIKVSLNSSLTGSGSFTADSSGVWSGSVTLSGVDLTKKYSIYIKGPKHLQKRVCTASPSESSPGRYTCNTDGITLKAGTNSFNFSNILLLAGDLPDQDGVVDSSDLSFIRQHLGSTDADDLEVGDVNLDGVINTQDYSLVIAALAIKTDDPVN